MSRKSVPVVPGSSAATRPTTASPLPPSFVTMFSRARPSTSSRRTTGGLHSFFPPAAVPAIAEQDDLDMDVDEEDGGVSLTPSADEAAPQAMTPASAALAMTSAADEAATQAMTPASASLAMIFAADEAATQAMTPASASLAMTSVPDEAAAMAMTPGSPSRSTLVRAPLQPLSANVPARSATASKRPFGAEEEGVVSDPAPKKRRAAVPGGPCSVCKTTSATQWQLNSTICFRCYQKQHRAKKKAEKADEPEMSEEAADAEETEKVEKAAQAVEVEKAQAGKSKAKAEAQASCTRCKTTARPLLYRDSEIDGGKMCTSCYNARLRARRQSQKHSPCIRCGVTSSIEWYQNNKVCMSCADRERRAKRKVEEHTPCEDCATTSSQTWYLDGTLCKNCYDKRLYSAGKHTPCEVCESTSSITWHLDGKLCRKCYHRQLNTEAKVEEHTPCIECLTTFSSHWYQNGELCRRCYDRLRYKPVVELPPLPAIESDVTSLSQRFEQAKSALLNTGNWSGNERDEVAALLDRPSPSEERKHQYREVWNGRFTQFRQDEPAHCGLPEELLINPSGEPWAEVGFVLNHPTLEGSALPGEILDPVVLTPRIMMDKGITKKNTFVTDMMMRREDIRKVADNEGKMQVARDTWPTFWKVEHQQMHFDLHEWVRANLPQKLIIVAGRENSERLSHVPRRWIRIPDSDALLQVGLPRNTFGTLQAIIFFVWHPSALSFPGPIKRAVRYDAELNFVYDLAKIPLRREYFFEKFKPKSK